MPHDITRRTLLKTAALGSIAAATGAGRAWSKAASQPPNIIYIMADDLGYADVGCYGRADIRTPNIDRLAKDGARFLQAYANSSVCSATRTALITGRYQYRLRVGLEEPLAGMPGMPDIGLPPEHPTLPSLLRKLGYDTTLIGKWHLGLLPAFGPLQSGYDHFYGFRGGAIDYYTHTDSFGRGDLWDNDTKVERPGYLTELLGERTVDTVNAYARSKQPFLISLHFNAPHWPWEAPGDEAESQRVIAKKDIRHYDGGNQRTYRAMVEAMDTQIGRVMKALQSRGLANNTIVIFTSDNGGERFSDTWPFTGKKTELLEGGLRVPAIVSWPSRIPRGSTSQQTAMSMDWLPTLLAAAGGAPDPAHASDGMNLLPMLADGATPIQRSLFWRYKANAQRAVRDGDFKYLKILDNTFLFNVVDDPQERANLKTRQPEVYARLEKMWLDWNATMLPELDESFTDSFSGNELADHIGTPRATGKADNPTRD